ncbi:MAG: LssY C-terminal domain-containing protein [Pirellulaceae bacterium]|nr:LssY C-terminal domain-containing protein [Pirellulaceae bacterium]
MSGETQDPQPPRPREVPWRTVAVRGTITALLAYLVVAYVLLPLGWRSYLKHHPALADAPTVTHTKTGIPGDPLNIALVGSETALHRGMLAAGWYPADPVTLETSLRIAADTVLRRSYDEAPVSSLFLFGRKQDFAFEFPIGNDPRRRHHVRYWKMAEVDAEGRPAWIGAATLDVRVGLSHTTGEVTHHIGPDIDAERDKIIADLRRIGDLAAVYWIEGFQPRLSGKNGGGDPYRTDGRLGVGELGRPQPMPAKAGP